MPYVSRNRDQYTSMRAVATTRQAGSTREPIKPVEQEEGMYHQGPAVPGRSPESCLQGGKAGTILPMEDH